MVPYSYCSQRIRYLKQTPKCLISKVRWPCHMTPSDLAIASVSILVFIQASILRCLQRPEASLSCASRAFHGLLWWLCRVCVEACADLLGFRRRCARASPEGPQLRNLALPLLAGRSLRVIWRCHQILVSLQASGNVPPDEKLGNSTTPSTVVEDLGSLLLT